MTEPETNAATGNPNRAAALNAAIDLAHTLGPLRHYDVERAACDAYSVVWEAGKRRRRDHTWALMAAIAAVAPLIEAGFLARHGDPARPVTIALNRLAPGMAVLLTHEHGVSWAQIQWMEPGDATGRTANLTWLTGGYAGEPISRRLTEPAYHVRIW